MKLTTQQENEILQVYHAYWDNYIKGDVEAMHPLLADEYTQVGSAESEVFSSKKDAVQFLYDTIEQVAGKIEMRNRKTTFEQQGHAILVHEFCDLFAWADGNWIFYSKFRASTFMQQKTEGWKIIHQHSSFPDTKAEDGQNIAIDKIAAENLQLREAVKRRTIELEQKNRKLQIETSLEKVRAEAMGMNKPDDILAICKVMFKELQGLGFSQLRNTLINFWDDEHSSLIDYDYSDETGGHKAILSYSSHPVFEQFQKKIKNSQDAFAELVVTKEELESWKQRRRDSGEYEDPRLNQIDALYYYFYSIGVGAIGISTFSSITEEQLNILKLFRNVFDFAYRRYADVAQAESQAREAEIQLALERVRARSMAMHKSEELAEASVLLFEQLKLLGVSTYSSGFSIWENEHLISWMCNADGSINPPFKMPVGGDAWQSLQHESWKNGEVFIWKDLQGEEMQSHFRYLRSFPLLDEAFKKSIAAGHPMPERQVHHVANFSHGNLLFITLKPCPEAHDIFIRFAKVFEQTYTRFLDLQKAEAQAKEAKIQLALERVRARSMAMHKSEELADLSLELVKQVQALGVATWFCAFNINDDDPNSSLEWGSNGKGTFPKYRTPREGVFLRYYKAAQNGGTFFINEIGENECPAHYEYLCSLPGVGDQLLQMKAAGIPFPASQIDHVAFFKYGYLLFITYEPVPEAHEIFIRFAKVFEQTYTRFLDLQKAEAQAREAQIEVSLERVRSRAMAMQNSEELNALIGTVFTELTKLDLVLTRCLIMIFNEEKNDSRWWMANSEDPENPMDFYVKQHDHPPMAAFFKAWRDKKLKWTYVLEGQVKNEWDDFIFSETELLQLPEFVQAGMRAPGRVNLNVSFNNFGCITLASIAPLPDEHFDIMLRFAKVFDLTYTRFNDLKQAEAQAREAQIEAVLERVRGRTMAMQKSDELTEVAGLLFEQVSALGIKTWTAGFNVWSDDNNSYVDYITSPQGGFIEPYTVYTETAEALTDISHARKSGVEFDVQYVDGEKIKQLYLALTKLDEKQYEIMLQDGIRFPSHQYEHFVFGSRVSLMFITYEPVPEAHDVFKRLGKVFEQTYTRFLDLQKAEAQTREAQINLAVERVRARALAMLKSEEILELVFKLKQEMLDLDIPNVVAATIHLKENDGNYTMWDLTSMEYTDGKLHQPMVVHYRLEEVDPNLFIKRMWENTAPYFLVVQDEGDFKRTIQFLRDNGRKKEADESEAYLKNAGIRYGYHPTIPLHNGRMCIDLLQPPSDEIELILTKMGAAFDLAYKRFEDLKNSEVQLKEAQIENALEKVRSRTMAMQHSSELSETSALLFLQIQTLGVPPWSCGFNIWEQGDAVFTSYMGKPEGVVLDGIKIPLTEEATFIHFQESRDRGDKLFIDVLEGETLQEHYRYFFTVPGVKEALEKRALEGEQLPTLQINHLANFSYGNLMFITYEPCPGFHDIFIRFAKVFDQTYTRFLDLQKAEAQAREARIEAALEKARSRTMGMQSSDELPEVANVLFLEVQGLGIPAWSCGYNILAEDKTSATCCMSSEGTLQTPFKLRLFGEVSFAEMGDFFSSEQTMLVQELGGKALEEHYAYMKSFPDLKPTFDQIDELGLSLPTYQINHLCKFTQGFLLFITYEKVPDSHDIFKRFTKVFDQTYTRFLDLQKAEAQALRAEQDLVEIKVARKNAEEALLVLQSTQKQLIQSEKMASLGELTAGIAHEIQNPLNFVNNFSEVSKEMLDEMKDAFEKGDTEEAKEIMEDVIQNLEKINHHGKRADSIVKGMLQHSRSNSGTKEPTDINVLADEYLRLAYHGLRAKDKSFNAALKTDYDENIGKINIIPQEIGRVILNLITNAFYAVDEKKKKSTNGYEPTISVSTKKIIDKIEIKVEDNGNGIPQNILDKVFQPFFTTKPTGQGTGLGLSLSYDIVKAHGGEIKVETQENKGTEFIITLPL